MSVGADDGRWRRLIRSGQSPFWRLLAAGCGGTLWEDEGVVAAIIPGAPDRSIFNSVFYEQPEHLIASIDELAESYEEAGVRAWTVWVPEADAEVAQALADAGHRLDATPTDMGMELSELLDPEPDGALRVRAEQDLTTMARINEAAYGVPEGDFAAMATDLPGLRVYLGDLEGEAVVTLAIWPHGDDAVVAWVASLPEARGRGLSGRLLAHALREAEDSGLRTTTLQSTKLGRPVYERLGYRDYGTVQMWERRSDRQAAPSRSEGRSP